VGCGERGFEVRNEAVKWSGQCLPPRDENIVVACQPIKGKDIFSRSAQTPFGAVALDRASHSAACRDANANGAVSPVRGRAQLDGQSRCHEANTLGGAKKIGALFQTPERRLLAV